MLVFTPIYSKPITLYFFHRRAVIGEVDEDLDGRIDFENLRAEPLNPVVH